MNNRCRCSVLTGVVAGLAAGPAFAGDGLPVFTVSQGGGVLGTLTPYESQATIGSTYNIQPGFAFGGQDLFDGADLLGDTKTIIFLARCTDGLGFFLVGGEPGGSGSPRRRYGADITFVGTDTVSLISDDNPNEFGQDSPTELHARLNWGLNLNDGGAARWQTPDVGTSCRITYVNNGGTQVTSCVVYGAGNAGVPVALSESLPVTLTLIDAPAPCGLADVAEPFGLLDLTDITTFVNAFTAQEPLADVAEPFGLYDLADVNTFIATFQAGCP